MHHRVVDTHFNSSTNWMCATVYTVGDIWWKLRR